MMSGLLRSFEDRLARWSPASGRNGGTAGALAVAVAIWIAWTRRPIALTDPPECRGILELLSTLALTQIGGLSVGTLTTWVNGTLAILALAAVTRLVQVLTGSLFAAAATAAALAATSTFDRVLGPAAGLGVLAATSAAWLAIRRMQPGADGLAAIRLLALGTVPLLAPALLVPAALLGAWAASMWTASRPARTLVRLLLAGASMVAATAGVLFGASAPFVPELTTVGGLTRCVGPSASAAGLVQGARNALAEIGPFPMALAGLGALAAAGRLKAHEGWWALALGIAPVAWGGWRDGSAAAGAPLVAGFWCLTGVGISELMQAVRPRWIHRLAASALVLLLPLLQFQRLHGRDAADAAAVFGHARLTAETVWRELRALPDVSLVTEDASTDLLLHALSGRMQRSGKRLTLVPRDEHAIAAARLDGRVLAFPRAQHELQHRGVQFARSPARAAGLAEVGEVHPCARLTEDWREPAAATATRRFALVARRPGARGPITIVVGGGEGISALPLDWIPRQTRGFQVRPYRPAERARVRALLMAEGVAASSAVLAAPHVLRIVMWRTPDAGAVLPVELSRRPEAVIARAEPDSGARWLELCPSFQFEPERVSVESST